MAIPPGTRLGPYEILSAIGAGGMGEVYQAHDTKLGRDVAIKVLPEAFAHDRERLSRFQREAKVLASLNHPNIAAIYGLEENAGSSYLVLELVPGDTLADRIRREGAIPVEETLTIAKQMAEALEAAHDKGIVHRDLKPANVKVTPDGKVKVLDFGLAKALAEDDSHQDSANSPTMSHAATMQGIILGTAAYMSPEQARGKQVDKRADIWAFGVVLYEMLTGEQLFAGETVSDTLAAVLRHEPDWSKVPARMQRLLRSCLEKEPKKRLRDIGDMDLLIQEGPAQGEEPLSLGSGPRWLWAVTAAACLLAAGLAVLHFRVKPAAAPEIVRFQIRLPDNVVFTRSAALALSPDGHHVAFPAIGPEGHPAVWVQDLDADEARELPDTATLTDVPPLFWSPDSRFVVFTSQSARLRKFDLQVATPQDITDSATIPIGGSWNPDGTIIFGSFSTGLSKVPATGGTPVPVTVLDASRQEHQHELPVFLPDGRHFLYLSLSKIAENTGIYVGSIDDAPERQNKKLLLATGFGVSYAPTDDKKVVRLLFLRGDTLMAQNLDLTGMELTGEPSPIVERIGTAFETGHFSATSGVLAYRGKAPGQQYQFTWFDDQGKVLGKVGDPGDVADPSLSPDGSRLAFDMNAPKSSNVDTWLIDLAKGTSTRFTFGPAQNGIPVWSPDGKEIVFASNRSGIFALYRKPADGSKIEQLLFQTHQDVWPSSWSHDGRFLMYDSSQNHGPEDAWLLPMRGGAAPFSIPGTIATIGYVSDPQFSPDGRWIAYSSNETGQPELYVREFSGAPDPNSAAGKWIVSRQGGLSPHWRADGKEIVYQSLNLTTLMSVSVDTSHSFQAGTPRVLFDMPADRGSGHAIAATPDLKRFLLPVAIDQKLTQSFTVILNWTSGLKK